MTKEKSKPKHKSKSSSLKRSLNILMGGEENARDGAGAGAGAGDGANKPESAKSTSFFSFLDRFKSEKPEMPKDYKASNGADMDADADADAEAGKGITFKSNKLLSVLSPSEAASVSSGSSNSESSPSIWWFVFRVIIVFLIVIVFALNLTGYLEITVEWFKQQIELTLIDERTKMLLILCI